MSGGRFLGTIPTANCFSLPFSESPSAFTGSVHAYCLMNNHYHLVIETPDGNLSKGCAELERRLHSSYSIDATTESGIYFRGDLRGILVQKESHFLEVCRYVVLNPVRAEAVDHPRLWACEQLTGQLGGLATIPDVSRWMRSSPILARGVARAAEIPELRSGRSQRRHHLGKSGGTEPFGIGRIRRGAARACNRQAEGPRDTQSAKRLYRPSEFGKAI